ncbi:MAG: DUF6746 family protein [Deltaproteobacteria bacterium]
MSKIFALLMLFASFTAISAADGERPDHFKGKPAETLKQAVANFSEGNSKLAAILSKSKLAPDDIIMVHELTYTLENALEKINNEFAALADTLESLHLASEKADYNAAKKHGAAYLKTAQTVVK